ncbi:MAG: hypothetical protein U5K74_04590 [Gemmatimonadaceae bacterium]|nr:hypothetical protein [Gemmatimonadaceae bacterium]
MIPTELNDAAFIVVQLEPNELDDIKALRDTLRHFAVFDATATTQVRAHAQHAATSLNLILLGGAGDPAALLVQASESIDAAIRAADASSRGEPRITKGDLIAIVHDAGDAEALSQSMASPSPSAPAPQAAAPVAERPAPPAPAPAAAPRQPAPVDARQRTGAPPSRRC